MNQTMKDRIKIPGSLFVQCLVADLLILSIVALASGGPTGALSWFCLIPYLVVNIVLGWLKKGHRSIFRAVFIAFSLLVGISVGDVYYLTRVPLGQMAMLNGAIAILTVLLFFIIAAVLGIIELILIIRERRHKALEEPLT